MQLHNVLEDLDVFPHQGTRAMFISMVLEVLDRDESGVVLRADFVMLLLGAARGTNAQRLAAAFNAFDANNDSNLTRVCVHAIMPRYF